MENIPTFYYSTFHIGQDESLLHLYDKKSHV